MQFLLEKNFKNATHAQSTTVTDLVEVEREVYRQRAVEASFQEAGPELGVWRSIGASWRKKRREAKPDTSREKEIS